MDDDDRLKLRATIANWQAEINDFLKQPQSYWCKRKIAVNRRLIEDAELALEENRMPKYKRVKQ